MYSTLNNAVQAGKFVYDVYYNPSSLPAKAVGFITN